MRTRHPLAVSENTLLLARSPLMAMWPRATRRSLVVVLTLVMALVATAAGGCSRLPTSGDIHEFPIEAPLRDPIRQFGAAPQAGSNPQRIVEDFLRASAAGIYDDFATARMYLQPEASVTWRPYEQVVIFPTDAAPNSTLADEGEEEAQVSLALTTLGTIDKEGILQTAATQGSTLTSFTLTKNTEGEWRISALDDGLILSQSAFLDGYQSSNLYFPSSDLSALIPDPRWYPRARMASYLMQGLIAGPSEELAPTVAGDLAADLSLPTGGIEVHDRVATVNLEGPLLFSEQDRIGLSWSITETLRQVPTVQSVDIRLNGVAQHSDPLPSGPAYRLDRVTGIRAGEVLVGSTPTLTTVQSAGEAGENASDPSIGPVESSSVAWRVSAENALFLTQVGADTPREFSLAKPGEPSVDRYGNVWATQGGLAGAVVMFPANEESEPVKIPVGHGGTPIKVALSPDGARIIFLVRGNGGSTAEVLMGTVVRDPRTHAYSVTAVHQLDQFSSGTVDIAWMGETTVVGLAVQDSGEASVQVLPLRGWIQTYSAPPDVVRVTASTSIGSILVQRNDNTLFQRAGAAWIELGDETKDINFAG